MGNIKKRIWIEALSIGNAKEDYKNHKLFEILNDLDELIEFKKGKQEFAKILTKMTDYSLNHFEKEDEYMRKMAYPFLREHKKSHRDYIYKVAMFNVNLLNGNSPDPKEVISFLEKWWVNHVNKYEKYNQEIQSNLNY